MGLGFDCDFMQYALAFGEYIEAHLDALVLVHIVQVDINIRINDQISYTPIKPSKRQLNVEQTILSAPRPRIIDPIDLGHGVKLLIFSVNCVLERCLIHLIGANEPFEYISVFQLLSLH